MNIAIHAITLLISVAIYIWLCRQGTSGNSSSTFRVSRQARIVYGVACLFFPYVSYRVFSTDPSFNSFLPYAVAISSITSILYLNILTLTIHIGTDKVQLSTLLYTRQILLAEIECIESTWDGSYKILTKAGRSAYMPSAISGVDTMLDAFGKTGVLVR